MSQRNNQSNHSPESEQYTPSAQKSKSKKSSRLKSNGKSKPHLKPDLSNSPSQLQTPVNLGDSEFQIIISSPMQTKTRSLKKVHRQQQPNSLLLDGLNNSQNSQSSINRRSNRKSSRKSSVNNIDTLMQVEGQQLQESQISHLPSSVHHSDLPITDPAQPQQASKKKTKLKKQPKQPLTNIDVKIMVDYCRIDIYVTISRVYIQNLIYRRDKAEVSTQQQQRFGENLIIYQEIQFTQDQLKSLLGNEFNHLKENVKQAKAVMYILNQPYEYMEIKFNFPKILLENGDHVWLGVAYSTGIRWVSRSILMNLVDEENTFCGKIKNQDIKKYIIPNLNIHLSATRYERDISNQFFGIINLGNTCYMNSCLQMLFFIRPFRKIILEQKSNNKIIKALRNVFSAMMDSEENQSVDIQPLLQAYDKFNEIPRRQQDVQEFLLDFIFQVQQKCEAVKNLWSGRCSETTQSIEKDKPYKSTLLEDFCQLDVHMNNQKGEQFKTIQESLRSLLHEEEVDEQIENDQFGRIKVAKHKRFQILPDILFVNIKRYEFSRQKMKMFKIFNHIEHTQRINLQFLMQQNTPGRQQEQGNKEFDYCLFAVIVHKGTSSNSGHYFSFVNTSTDVDKPKWFEFNDSKVREMNQREVLMYPGKKQKQVFLDRVDGLFSQRQVQSCQSSYLLVYFRQKIFQQYQKLDVEIPESYVEEKRRKKEQEQKRSMMLINIFVLPQSCDNSVNLFEKTIQFTSLHLHQDQETYHQFQANSSFLLQNEILRLYKVNIRSNDIRQIQKCSFAHEIMLTKRGHFQTDYVLVVTKQNHWIQEVKRIEKQTQMEIQIPNDQYNIDQNDSTWGILVLLSNQIHQTFPFSRYTHICASELIAFQNKVFEKGGQIKYINEQKKVEFEYGWVHNIQIQILKI